MSKAKKFCNSKDCSFKPVVFNTFEYMYCSVCKCEVTEEMVEYKARQKAERGIVNPHMNNDSDDDQMDLFDLWNTSV